MLNRIESNQWTGICIKLSFFTKRHESPNGQLNQYRWLCVGSSRYTERTCSFATAFISLLRAIHFEFLFILCGVGRCDYTLTFIRTCIYFIYK